MEINLEEIKKFCKKLILEQSKLAMEGYYLDKEIKLKSNKSIVTKYDRLISKNIVSALKEKYKFNIKSEEQRLVNRNSDYTFFIDPIDGTRAYTYKLGFFSVGLALSKGDNIIFCMNYIPLLKELYYSIKNKGAYLNDKKISVSKTSKLSDSMVFLSKSEIKSKNFMIAMKKIKSKNFSLSSFKTTDDVAEGNLDGYFGKVENFWDLCQYLLVVEAGGVAIDFNGKEFNLKSKNFIFSNKAISSELQKLLSKKHN